MKLTNILIVIVIAPVLAYLTSQIMWALYELFDLFSFVTPATFDSLTTSLFIATLGMVVVYGLKPKRGSSTMDKLFTEKSRATKKVKVKGKKPFGSLNKDFTIQDVTQGLRPSKKKPFLEFIIVGKGKNLHQKIAYKKNLKYKGENGVVYMVKNENLMIQKSFFGHKKLIALFNQDGKPITVKDTKKNVSAEILSLADRSTALGRSLKEMFSVGLNLKKILFFIGIGIVAVVVIFIFLGGGF